MTADPTQAADVNLASRCQAETAATLPGPAGAAVAGRVRASEIAGAAPAEAAATNARPAAPAAESGAPALGGVPAAAPVTAAALASRPCRGLCHWRPTRAVRGGRRLFACRGCGSQWTADQAWCPCDADGTVPAAIALERARARATIAPAQPPSRVDGAEAATPASPTPTATR